MSAPLPTAAILEIHRLRATGLSQDKIAAQLEIGQHTVSHWLRVPPPEAPPPVRIVDRPRGRRSGIDWRNVPCPPVRHIPGPVHVSPGAQWCANCGEDVPKDFATWEADGRSELWIEYHVARCCDNPRLVPVEQVLQPGEYEVRT